MGKRSEIPCVICGNRPPFIGPVCMSCYLKGNPALQLPDYVDVEHCPVCGARHRKATWVDHPSITDAIESSVLEAVRIAGGLPDPELSLEIKQVDRYIYRVDVKAVLGDESFLASTNVRIRENVCARCSRAAGNYYEAILQIRTSASKMDPDALDWARKAIDTHIASRQELDRNVFVSKILNVRGGMDFYISSIGETKALAGKLASHFAVRVSESPKLVGRKDGRDLYRVTFLVRIPNFSTGDIIMLDNGPAQILNVNTRKIKVIALESHRIHGINNTSIPDSRVYHREGHVHDALVVSVDPGGKEIELMDPVTYSTITVTIPGDVDHLKGGQSVKVARIEERLYLLPLR